MKSMRKLIPVLALVLVGLAFPSVMFAHDINFWGMPPGYWGPLVSCTGDYLTGTGPKCQSFCDMVHTAQHILYFALTILMFVIAPIMIVAGGILIIFSGGSPKTLGTGRGMATGAIIGVAIGLGAFVIVNTFFFILGNGTDAQSVSWSEIECSAPAQN
jgi:hypothetical protein